MIRSGSIYAILFLILSAGIFSCERLLTKEDPADNPVNNFDMLWHNLDRKYSLFTAKGIDWDSIYQVYRPEIHEAILDSTLFQTVGRMILELKDGHTDINSPYGYIDYDYTIGSSRNFVPHIIKHTYLGTEKKERDGMLYNIVDTVGYLYIGSFSTEITEDGIREVLNYFSDTKGIIIDVRNNTGGNDRYCKIIANHFFDQKRMVEINHYKTGPGHDDFGTIDLYIEPNNGLGIFKPAVILTNRVCYSACNSFVSWMSSLPHVSIVGDTTGGGGGTPYFSELPNGWIYRYSANKSYRPDGLNLDYGIPPDHLVTLTKKDSTQWRDTLIEYALDLINQ
jgi:hypothetical protein